MLRRDFLLGSGALGASALGISSLALTSCATITSKSASQTYSPVKASWNRVLKTEVGLRPFRPEGYRIEPEAYGDKLVVHNYGHGGGGISLSWGSALLASQYVWHQRPNAVAVLGAGVMGITTALLLAQSGVKVTVYASNFVPNTTSNIAAALWLPSSYVDRKAVKPSFFVKDEQIARTSFSRFLNYVNHPEYCVYWHRYHFLNNKELKSTRELPGGNALYPEMTISKSDNLFGFPYQVSMQCLMIDPSFYLRKLMQDAQMAGVKFEMREFESLNEVLALRQAVLMNCTGLGARTLFGDEALLPIQGQMTHLIPQPEINYSYVTPAKNGFLYMFPRKGAIVLGGTSVKGEYSTEPNMELAKNMVQSHAELASRLLV